MRRVIMPNIRALPVDWAHTSLRRRSRGVRARGFALVRNLRGTPVRQAAAVSRGMAMDIEFFDGRVRASAEATSLTPAEKPVRIIRNRGRRGGDPGQGSLFG